MRLRICVTAVHINAAATYSLVTGNGSAVHIECAVTNAYAAARACITARYDAASVTIVKSKSRATL